MLTFFRQLLSVSLKTFSRFEVKEQLSKSLLNIWAGRTAKLNVTFEMAVTFKQVQKKDLPQRRV